MNICMIVSAVFPPREGMGTYVWNLSGQLIRQGHQVQIITRGGAGKPFCEVVDGVTIWRPFFAPLYPFHVHLHGLFVARLIRILEAQVDVFHSHSPLVPPIQTSRPVMLSFHSTVPDDIKAVRVDSWYTLLMKLQVPISYWLEVENIKAATLVNAISPRVAGLLQKYPHCPKTIPVVWNAVDTQLFKPYPQEAPRNGFILSVGWVGPGKGLEDLIEAVSLLSLSNLKQPVRLVVIGDGPLRPLLEQRVKDLNLQEQVSFEGHISDRNRLVDFYRRASCFVLPSHHEGLPTVVLEAMACGCPVIATHVGGIPNLIKEGLNGILVQPRNPHLMAFAIQALLENPEKAHDMGSQARRTIEQGFSWEKISSNFIDRYSSMQQLQGNQPCISSQFV